ncbi:family 2 encapsulin nanocompartment cargo protein polyprenyl transferase [Nonomuraea rosea]|uniref:Family 2 encapsulin nanocompartment cargo protein polyprenyl transferase n=1 Tax=Nonomuraea rosea TaxID=638574 RepID=A0ABP6X1U8_9ACTN
MTTERSEKLSIAMPGCSAPDRPDAELAAAAAITKAAAADRAGAVQAPQAPNTRTARGADRILGEARRMVEPAHRAVVAQLDGPLREVAEYHAGWREIDGSPAHGGGKAIRSALALACARAAADRTAARSAALAALPVGVAVELVHDFSMLHDDVMDGDVTRRHRPAAWTVFGVGAAVLVGDALLLSAIRHLAASPVQQGAGVLAATVVEMCEGQWADLAFASRADVSLPACLAMAEAKTGALMGAACQLGALAAGAGPGAARSYRVFGRQLGLAFQLVDDLLGIWGDPQVTGKPVGADLAVRKKSLPVVAALASGTEAAARLARLYAGPGDLDEAAVAQAADLVEAAGGRAWAQAEAERCRQGALHALAGTRPMGGAEELVTLAALVTERSH